MKKLIVLLITFLFCLSGCSYDNYVQNDHEPQQQINQSSLQSEPETELQPESEPQPETESQPESEPQPDIYAEPVTDVNEQPKAELDDNSLALQVAQYLGVPDMTDVTYEIGEKLYWEAGGRYYKYVTFYQNGEIIASASVDPSDGKLIKSIQMYQEKTEEEFE